MKKNSKIEQKYYNFLVDLKRKIDTGEPFSSTEFAAKRRISTSIMTYLIQFKYVKKLSYVYKKGYTYQWTGSDPSIRMVNKIRKEHSKVCSSYVQKQTPQKKVVVNTLKPRKKPEQIAVKGATEIKVVNPKTMYTKVFFGLFTLKSTIQY